jgi:hypothetical protein
MEDGQDHPVSTLVTDCCHMAGDQPPSALIMLALASRRALKTPGLMETGHFAEPLSVSRGSILAALRAARRTMAAPT